MVVDCYNRVKCKSLRKKKLKTAIVHDWLVTYGGAERVLERMLKAYPSADLYSVCDFLPDNEREFLGGRKSTTSFIQKMPLARKYYRKYLPLMPLAIEQHDLTGYDLVISSSYAVAKGVITGPDQLHVCMCYSPMRYAWDLMHQYLKQTNLDRGVKSWLTRYMLHRMRIWDQRTAHGVDQFIAISDYIARRIKKCYGRDSEILYPPVDIDRFKLYEQKEEYYLTASRMVPYKRIDLIVEAFSLMPDKRLIVIGDGPEMGRIRAKAGDNIEIMGHQPGEVMIEKMQKAKAFIFAAEEDFGIVPIEAQACGTPVIAYRRGGALETVEPGVSGLFFNEQTTSSIISTVGDFEMQLDQFNPITIRQNAEKFSNDRFDREFNQIMEKQINGRFPKTMTGSKKLTLTRNKDRTTQSNFNQEMTGKIE